MTTLVSPRGNHWSASRFMLFEECPQKYKERYVDGVVAEPSLAMLFGHSVHVALEALLQGPGGGCLETASRHTDHLECARSTYFRAFDRMRRILAPEGVTVDGILYLEGLRMIDQVNYLKLNRDGRSKSEHQIEIPTEWAGLNWPVVGAVDLWSPPGSQHGPTIWDFKTTVGSWSQTRAERERWQPLLYTWAYLRAYGTVPTFRYLVLNRINGEVETFDRRWKSKREVAEDLNDLEFHADEIAEAVAEGNFDCTRGHGTCLECGEPYGHGHVCRTPSRPKVTLTGRSGQPPIPLA
jgi:hypothetical protein